MLLAFEGLTRPVSLIDCDDLLGYMSAIMPSWEATDWQGGDAEPFVTLSRSGNRYCIVSDWRTLADCYRDPVDAVCTFVVDLVKAYIASDESLLCLHSAAVDMGGTLVVFPSAYKAGKSTLSAYLMSAGHRLFADDVIPIRAPNNMGVATGVTPRLRLPLPDNASTGLRLYVDTHKGPGNKRYQYIDAGPDELADHAVEAPIGGFVLLNREDGVEASLEPTRESEMLKRVVLRNFARDGDAIDILERLHGLVGAVPCYRLNYDDGERAVALLEETFARA